MVIYLIEEKQKKEDVKGKDAGINSQRDTKPTFKKREAPPTKDMEPLVEKRVAYEEAKSEYDAALVKEVQELAEELRGTKEDMGDVKAEMQTLREHVDKKIGIEKSTRQLLVGLNDLFDELKKDFEKLKKEIEKEKVNIGKEKADIEEEITKTRTLMNNNVKEITEKIGDLRELYLGIDERLTDVGTTVRRIEDSTKSTEHYASDIDGKYEAMEEKVEVLKNSITPPPNEGAMGKVKEIEGVASKLPYPVDLSKITNGGPSIKLKKMAELAKKKDAVPGEKGVKETGEASTKDAKNKPVSIEPKEPEKPQLKVVKSIDEKKEEKYPDATMEKAEEHAEKLEENKENLDDIEGSVKQIIEMLGSEDKLTMPQMNYKESEDVKLLKGLGDTEGFSEELIGEIGKNLEAAYEQSAMIKGLATAVGAIAARKKLHIERIEMQNKITTAKMPLKEYDENRTSKVEIRKCQNIGQIIERTINKEQAHVGALIACNKECADAMAEVLSKVIEKIKKNGEE